MSFLNLITTNIEPTINSGSTTLPKDSAQSDVEQRVYTLGWKIFEGFLLVVMNLTVVGALANFEMLRGDKSFLKREYQRVFADKEITVIKGKTSGSPTSKKFKKTSGECRSDSQRRDDHEGSGSGSLRIPVGLPLATTGGSTDLTVAEKTPPKQNPVIGQAVQVTYTTDGRQLQMMQVDDIMDNGSLPQVMTGETTPKIPEGVSFNLELVDLIIEVTGEMPTFQQPALIDGSGTPPLLEGGSPLGERSLVPVKQNTGVLSRVGSAFGSGMDLIFGEKPQPQLHVVGKFRAVIDKVEHIYSVTIDTPLTGDVNPQKLIEQEMLRQLPPEVTRQHLPAIKYEGESTGSGHIIPAEVEELSDEDEDEGGITIPRFITPHSMQSTAMQSRTVVEATQGLVQLPKAQKSSQDQMMMAARIASVRVLSQAVAFRLNNMPSQNLSHKVDNGLTLYNAVPTVGTFSWLAEVTGMSARVGFNPYGIGIAAVFAAMSGLWFSGRGNTKSFVHRETSEVHSTNKPEGHDRKVAKVDPSTQKQGWLDYFYGCFAYIASTVGQTLSYALPNTTPSIEPKYSEIHTGPGGSSVRFDLWGTRYIGPTAPHRRRQVNPIFQDAAFEGTAPRRRRQVNPIFQGAAFGGNPYAHLGIHAAPQAFWKPDRIVQGHE